MAPEGVGIGEVFFGIGVRVFDCHSPDSPIVLSPKAHQTGKIVSRIFSFHPCSLILVDLVSILKLTAESTEGTEDKLFFSAISAPSAVFG